MADLRQQKLITQELERQRDLLIRHNEESKVYQQAQIAIRKLSADLVNIEKEIETTKNKYRRKSSDVSLEKKIVDLEKSALGTMKKRLGLTGAIEEAREKIKNGTDDEVKNAGKYLSLLEDINNGSKDLSDVMETIATEDFGDMNNKAEKLGQILEKYPDILDNLGKEKKFADMIDQVKDTLGLIDLKKTFTFAGILALATEFASRISYGFCSKNERGQTIFRNICG